MYNHSWKEDMDRLVEYTSKHWYSTGRKTKPNHSSIMASLHPKAETLRYSKVAKAAT